MTGLAFLCDADYRKGKSGDLFPGALRQALQSNSGSTLKLNFKKAAGNRAAYWIEDAPGGGRDARNNASTCLCLCPDEQSSPTILRHVKRWTSTSLGFALRRQHPHLVFNF